MNSATLTPARNPLEVITDKAFKTVGGDVVTTQTVANFVKYIGNFIQVKVENGQELNPKTILNAARSIIEARLNMKSDDGKALLGKFNDEVTKLLEASTYAERSTDFSSLAFDGKYTFTQAVAKVLTAIPEANLKTEPLDKQQEALEEMFVQRAVGIALKAADKDGGVNPAMFSNKLTEIINQNPQALSQATVGKLTADLNEAGFTSYGFYALSKIDGLKDLASGLPAGDIKDIKAEDKQTVTESLFGLLQNQNKEGFDLQAELSKLNLTGKQLGYLKHLAESYDKANQGRAAGDLAAMVTKALPGMAAPAIIGAGIGYLLGGSTFLGMFGALILSFLGGFGDNNRGQSEANTMPLPPPPAPSSKLVASTTMA